MDERDELVAPPAPDRIHALLDEAAEHRPQPAFMFRGEMRQVCDVCAPLAWWPCLVARLAAEVHALRKERRDD